MTVSGECTRVIRGARLLDQEMPGWWFYVDASWLCMGHRSRCVIGQLYGDYALAQSPASNLSDEERIEYGFNARASGWFERWREFRRLNRQWRECVKIRRWVIAGV